MKLLFQPSRDFIMLLMEYATIRAIRCVRYKVHHILVRFVLFRLFAHKVQRHLDDAALVTRNHFVD